MEDEETPEEKRVKAAKYKLLMMNRCNIHKILYQ